MPQGFLKFTPSYIKKEQVGWLKKIVYKVEISKFCKNLKLQKFQSLIIFPIILYFLQIFKIQKFIEI